MPTYVYENKKTGHVLELIRPLGLRDDCPTGYARVVAPTNFGFPQKDRPDPAGAMAKVPRALKEIERGERHAKSPISGSQIAKHFGMSLDTIRRAWRMCLVFALLLSCFSAVAGDITRGTTLVDGQRVSAAQFHSLVDNATINTTFLTGKPLQGTPAAADYILTYSAASQIFQKTTIGGAFLNNGSLFTGSSATTSFATNDLFLLYSIGGAQIENITSIALLTNLWNNTVVLWTNMIPLSAQSMWYLGGTNVLLNATNLFASMYVQAPFKSSSTNNDGLLALDGSTTNVFRIPWNSIYTNPYVQTVVSNGDYVEMWSVNTNVYGAGTNAPQRVTVSNLWPTMFISSSYAITNSAGLMLNIPHGLPARPQQVRWALVCTNADSGFVAGDEIPLSMGLNNPSGATPQNWNTGANATNVFLSFGNANIQAINKNTGGQVTLTPINWNAKCYAWWYPR